ncbi:putative lipid II flippase FtsW [Pseudomonadota bacterium]
MTVSQAQIAHIRPGSSDRDPWLLGIVLTLLATGLVMVYSVTVTTKSGSGQGNTIHLWMHLAYICSGLLVMLLVSLTPIGLWEKLSKPSVVIGLLMLGIVLIPSIGVQVNGSQRWINLGGLQGQPSELAKICLVLYVAGYLARFRDSIQQNKRGTIVITGILSLYALLLMIEPDFGSTVVLSGTIIAMLFLAGIRLLYVGTLVGLGVIGAVILTLIAPYRMQRVTSFLDPWSDPFDTGFQLVQALIAFGRGEWFGVGIGASIQKLFYLPHANTDFLLAVIAEELGLIGIILVVSLFTVLLWRVFAIARRAELSGQLFAARLAQGLGLLIVLQAMTNMGVNMGVLPTKGLTLPFMSYGGSSLLASCFAVGLLLMVDRTTRPTPGANRSGPNRPGANP